MRILFLLSLVLFSSAAHANWGAFNYSRCGGWTGDGYDGSIQVHTGQIANDMQDCSNFSGARACRTATQDTRCSGNDVVQYYSGSSCPDGYEDDGTGNHCILEEEDCTDKEGDTGPVSSYRHDAIYSKVGGVISPSFFCDQGCLTQPTCGATEYITIIDGVDVAYSNCAMTTTAFECEPGDAPEPLASEAPPEPTCKSGHKYGTVNGVKICLKPDGKIASTEPPKESSKDTSKETESNGDGTKTETETTVSTDSNGNKTTTITTTIINEGTGEVESESVQEETDKPDNDFASTECGAPPVCSGDAVQCAIATQTYELNCKFSGDAEDITGELLGVTDDDTFESLQGEGDENFFDISDVIDMSPFLSGSCPAPQSVNLGSFGSHDIPYTYMCSLAELLAYLVMASASLLCIRIIGT